MNWQCSFNCGGCPNPLKVDYKGPGVPCYPVCAAVSTNCKNAAKVTGCLDFLTCNDDQYCSPLVQHISVGPNVTLTTVGNNGTQITNFPVSSQNGNLQLVSFLMLFLFISYFLLI